ncbi:carbon-nitrogen hydrolase family protein [Sporolituus thermophilus]|uniref:N-carbamoylputrescine amidase n=1 Tax=Sporolituus thermophilus DSM 23256 TaxID=1123285 RepID=A0A1G7L7A4_9FIRM|nr:carbon-nitrogen hydrolase family protein [Sporolituus thermophilus]SDF45407.1 N-carbamoylputrescine amidase [Sporolituus thermophilus DSM 23256]
MRLRVAAVQTGAYKGDYDAQLANIARLVRSVAASGLVDVICLPELMTTPYFARCRDAAWRDKAEPLADGPTYRYIAALAREVRCAIVATCYERCGERRYNTAFIVRPDGSLAGRYAKTHIPYIEGVLAYETLYFDPGPDLPVFDVMGIPIGILICYDRSFPEAWRTLALKGAQVIFVPTSSSGYRGELYADELKVAAAQHQVFVVAANKAGAEVMAGAPGAITFYGKSRIISPYGQIIAALEREEDTFIVAKLDLAQVAAARQALNYYRDRRQDLYML